MNRVLALLRRVFADRLGSMAGTAAILLPVLFAGTALAVEYGNGLLTKSDNQRIADAAAYAAAVSYSQTGGTTGMQAAIDRVAKSSGLTSATLTYSVGTSPRGNGNTGITVTATTSVPLYFTQIISSTKSLTVVASANAEIVAGGPGCIFAISASGTGITMSGGTTMSAPSCIVQSNNTITAPCGTYIKALQIIYNSASAPSQPCGGLQKADGTAATLKKAAVTDPLAGNAQVAALTGRMTTVSGLTSPAAPTAPTIPSTTFDVTFGYTASSTQSQLTAAGCSGTFASPLWTVTCPAGSTKSFRTISIAGGITVKWGLTGNSSNIYNFKNTFDTGSGGGVTFGPGTYNFGANVSTTGSAPMDLSQATAVNVTGMINNNSSGGMTFGNYNVNATGGILNSNSGTMTFGAGTFNVGTLTTRCGSGTYSVCTTNGPIIFNYSSTIASTFNFSSGLYVGGGSTAKFAYGGTNASYRLGKSSDGNSITGGGGANIQFGDAAPSTGLFQAPGAINLGSGGGSCLIFPKADQHDINSSLDFAGGAMFGSGVYTINGYIAFGRLSGGAGNCNGTSVSAQGSNVVFVVSGRNTPTSGTCANQSFCIAAGYSNVTFSAAATSDNNKLLVIGPTSGTTGAEFGEGASGTSLSGTFYYPNGPILLGGGAGIGDKAGQCLTLIGTQISQNGGTVVASSCLGSGGGTGGSGTSTILLVR